MIPNLTIITPNYNGGRFLSRCLETVYQLSTTLNIEHIVCDNCSNDNSIDIIVGYQALYDLILISEKDTGPAQAINRGIKRATGEYILVLNSDDLLFPENVRQLFNHLHESKPPVIQASGIIHDLRTRKDIIYRAKKHTLFTYCNGISTLFHPGLFINRKSLGRVPYNELNNICWDAEYFLSILNLVDQTQKSHISVAQFNLHDLSISGGTGDYEKYRELKKELIAQQRYIRIPFFLTKILKLLKIC